jgi:hypothetical protein
MGYININSGTSIEGGNPRKSVSYRISWWHLVWGSDIFSHHGQVDFSPLDQVRNTILTWSLNTKFFSHYHSLSFTFVLLWVLSTTISPLLCLSSSTVILLHNFFYSTCHLPFQFSASHFSQTHDTETPIFRSETSSTLPYRYYRGMRKGQCTSTCSYVFYFYLF